MQTRRPASAKRRGGKADARGAAGHHGDGIGRQGGMGHGRSPRLGVRPGSADAAPTTRRRRAQHGRTAEVRDTARRRAASLRRDRRAPPASLAAAPERRVGRRRPAPSAAPADVLDGRSARSGCLLGSGKTIRHSAATQRRKTSAPPSQNCALASQNSASVMALSPPAAPRGPPLWRSAQAAPSLARTSRIGDHPRMDAPETIPALVIGGGPAGLMAAEALGGSGLAASSSPRPSRRSGASC